MPSPHLRASRIPAATLVAMLAVLAAMAASCAHRSAAAPPVPVDDQSDLVRRANMVRIVPGDDVIVVVSREPDLSVTLIVDEHSEIMLPRLGVINLTGYSPGSLRDTVRARYDKFLRDPAIQVLALRRISVNGAVSRPGVYPIDVTMNLRDVIARAGGVTSEANTSKVSIVRGNQEIPVPDWEHALTDVAELRSGDQILVGRKSWIMMNIGQVAGAVGVASSLIFTLVHR